jgi:ABC-type multidrug transport system permease subunit
MPQYSSFSVPSTPPVSPTTTTPVVTTPPINSQQQIVTRPQQNNAINAQTSPSNAHQPSTNSSSLLENPLIWIFVLSVLFFALLLRRLLLNYAATQMEGNGRNE